MPNLGFATAEALVKEGYFPEAEKAVSFLMEKFGKVFINRFSESDPTLDSDSPR